MKRIRVMVRSTFTGTMQIYDAITEEEASKWLWETCKEYSDSGQYRGEPIAMVGISRWEVV